MDGNEGLFPKVFGDIEGIRRSEMNNCLHDFHLCNFREVERISFRKVS